MLSPKRATLRLWPSAKAAAARIQPRQLLADGRGLPVADHDLARHPQARADEAVLAVAVGRLVEVHEVHVDRSHGMSRLNWVCRWHSGLRSSTRPAIHIFEGLKVCIHGDDAGARARGVRLSHQREDGVGSLHHRFPDERARKGRVQSLDHRLRMLVHLLEDVRAVEVLTAGHEPELMLLELDHFLISFSANAPRARYFT